MRIVGGQFRGSRLAAPKNDAIRPTSDRVREALFNILEHGVADFEVESARVLDLFAGSGALGLEALSRGAKYGLFIDNRAEARGLIRRNIESLQLTGIAKIWRRGATKLGPAGKVEPFDLVFLDPPYGKGLGEEALASVQEGGWIKAGGIAVLEEDARSEIELPASYEELDRRTYGDTQIVIMRAIES